MKHSDILTMYKELVAVHHCKIKYSNFMLMCTGLQHQTFCCKLDYSNLCNVNFYISVS